MQNSGEGNFRGLLLGLAIWALILVLTLVRYRPPAPKPIDAPSVEFSAERARIVLRQLVGDGVPHPVGSAADAAVRERILALLRNLGCAPEVQDSFACNGWGACAEVKNMLARIPGQEPRPEVLLAAHYDSVGAGPGASDDGVGVATILEIARAFKSLPPPRHSIAILIDEGEEAGLLGAIAFVQGHPWARDVRAAVNVDNRGTSGPSMMFETGSDNAWLMPLYAASVKHPVTSSFYYFGYKQMPNDTDFTVFKAAGIQGFNFAFVGDVAHYHTPLDNFENADPRSLQHHGDNALATVRALANADLDNRSAGEAVFFDVFAYRTVWWPVKWSRWLAVAGTLLFVWVIVNLRRRGFVSARAVAWGFLVWFAILLVAAVLAVFLRWVIFSAGGFPSIWAAHPLAAQIAFWAGAFAVVGALAVAFERRCGFWGLWAGVWAAWTLFSLVTNVLLPTVGYMFLIPAVAAALCGLLAAHSGSDARWKRELAGIVPAGVAAILGFAAVWFLYPSLGRMVLRAITIVVALMATTLAPLFGTVRGRVRWVFPLVAMGTTVVAAVAAMVVPPYSADVPERMNMLYDLDGDTGKAEWLVDPDSGRLPGALQQAATFRQENGKPFPWWHHVFAADAPHLDVPAPTLSIAQSSVVGTKRTIRALLRSPRGAPVASILFSPNSGVESFMMRGQLVPETYPRALGWRRGWRQYICATLPHEGIELSFTLPATAPADVWLIDESAGLPLEGLFLEKARPVTTTPQHEGDETIVSHHIPLAP
jgi:hypothetical protein